MPLHIADACDLSAADIVGLLSHSTSNLPELDAARRDLPTLRRAPQTVALLAQLESHLALCPPVSADAGAVTYPSGIPQTTYSQYRQFLRTGDREAFQQPYFAKRTLLTAAALYLFLGQAELKGTVQDILWAICEETNWVVPAHEVVQIDIMAAETGLLLSETLALLGDRLDAEVRARVRGEIERRIFEPYLRFHWMHWWHTVHHNWNAVCNSAIAATFLWLEPEPGRVAQALQIAFKGLREYVEHGFEPDGACTEGVGYWHYGLINLVALAEMIRSRTGGALDLLATERMRTIAAYPAKLLLSGTHFAAFADCDETLAFYPGIMARLAERTDQPSLLGMSAPPDGRSAVRPGGRRPNGENWRLPMALRTLLWWDGTYRPPPPITDAYLPDGGVARLVSTTASGEPTALAIQASHNAVNHNHNDVGTFVLHVAGENLLTDPGRGLYTRQFFGPERYDNIFANSYGHSVPRIGGVLQQAGRQYEGHFVGVELGGAIKRVEIEFARAYPLANLASARRSITLDETGVLLRDRFRFSENPLEVEAAFVTWAEVEIAGSGALVYGQRHGLRMTVEAPAGAAWRVEALAEQCRQNAKPGVLKRLTFALPIADEAEARVRLEFFTPRGMA
jgi:hypothetical protein